MQLALPPVVLDRRRCCLDRRACLRYLRLIVVVLQFEEEVALTHLLEVGDLNISDDASDLRTERRKIATNVCIVRDLLDPSPLP